MSNDTVVSLSAPARVSDPLTELLRTGARWLIEGKVSVGFGEYLSSLAQEKLPDGRQRVVRNCDVPERGIHTGLGGVDVRGSEGSQPLGVVGTDSVLLAGAAVRSALRES